MRGILYGLIMLSLIPFDQKTRQPALYLVTMVGMDFVPKNLTVSVGDTVRWINNSETWHNVIAIDKSFRSEKMDKKGDTFEFVFTKSGEFKYYCKPHRMMGMKGVVKVLPVNQ